jgi:hypothetical protein
VWQEQLQGGQNPVGRANAGVDGVPTVFFSHPKWWARRKGRLCPPYALRLFGTVPGARRYPADQFRFTHEAMGHVDYALSC